MINYSGYNIGCFAMHYIQNYQEPSGVVTTRLFGVSNSLLCTDATYSMSVVCVRERPAIGLFFIECFLQCFNIRNTYD